MSDPLAPFFDHVEPEERGRMLAFLREMPRIKDILDTDGGMVCNDRRMIFSVMTTAGYEIEARYHRMRRMGGGRRRAADAHLHRSADRLFGFLIRCGYPDLIQMGLSSIIAVHKVDLKVGRLSSSTIMALRPLIARLDTWSPQTVLLDDPTLRWPELEAIVSQIPMAPEIAA